MSIDDPVGEVVGDSQTYSLLQACVICGVATDHIIALVDFGIVVPAGERPASWRFNEYAIHRAKKALRLRRDLGLDLQGLALSLELLDVIASLRAQLIQTES